MLTIIIPMKKLILSLSLSLLITSSVFAIEYGGVGGRPAYPNPEIDRSDDIFIHTLAPGTNQEDGIAVVNNTEEEKYLLIYATDYTPSSGGGFACKQFLENKDSVGAWIKINKNLVKLPPLSQSTVNFLIEVPPDATPGEHNGCIAVQEYKPANADESGVSLATRTALRVAITIPGKVIQNLELQNFQQTIGETGKITLSPSIQNSGNVSVDTTIKVKTWDTFGNKIAEQGGDYSIIQDSTLELNFEVPRPLFGGIYHSAVDASYIHDQNKENLESKMLRYFVYPSNTGLLIIAPILFLILILIITSLIAQKRRRWIEKTWTTYIVKSGDTIQSIAKKKNTSWQIIAKVNQIAPPYELKPKTKIRAPKD